MSSPIDSGTHVSPPQRGHGQVGSGRVRREWKILPLCGLGALLLGGVMLISACGGARLVHVSIPRRVPPHAIAIVGDVPITTKSFKHWLAIVSRDPAGSSHAVQQTVSFLVRAQWLLQEAAEERISESAIDGLAARQASRSAQRGMSPSDAAFQARLDAITEILQRRHTTAVVSSTQVSRYYAAHRSQFREPAVRNTLMIITHDRASALRAKAALASGARWAAVATRWSIDSSALNGGRYIVVEGVQSSALVHVVFAARHRSLVGPLPASPAAQPGVTDYYLFVVTGGHGTSPLPLRKAEAEVRELLVTQAGQRSLTAFTRAYGARWKKFTLCGPQYGVPECGNSGWARSQ